MRMRYRGCIVGVLFRVKISALSRVAKRHLMRTILGLARNWVAPCFFEQWALDVVVRKHDRAGTIMVWWLGEKLGALCDIPYQQRPWLRDEEQVCPANQNRIQRIFLKGKALKLGPITRIEYALYMVAVASDARIEPPTTSKHPPLSPAAETMLKTLNARPIARLIAFSAALAHLPPFPFRRTFFGKSPRAFQIIRTIIKHIDASELAFGDLIHNILKARPFGFARDFL